MNQKTYRKIIIYFSIIDAVLVVLTILFFLSFWGTQLIKRISFEGLVYLCLALILVFLLPLFSPKKLFYFVCSIIYQLLVFGFCSNFLFRLATAYIMGYRLFNFSPHGFGSWLIINVPVVIALFVPVIFLLVFLKKSNISRLIKGNITILSFTALIFWAATTYTYNRNWYSLLHDINIDPEIVSNFTENVYNPSLTRMENAVKILNWVHHNISYEGSPVLLPLPKLILKAKGTCGIQSKIFGSLVKVRGYPVRFIALNSDDWRKFHIAVEVYVTNRWVYFDPQHNLVFYNDFGHPLSTWDLHSHTIYSSQHPRGEKLFENFLIFSDGHYFWITEKNYRWFYGG